MTGFVMLIFSTLFLCIRNLRLKNAQNLRTCYEHTVPEVEERRRSYIWAVEQNMGTVSQLMFASATTGLHAFFLYIYL